MEEWNVIILWKLPVVTLRKELKVLAFEGPGNHKHSPFHFGSIDTITILAPSKQRKRDAEIYNAHLSIYIYYKITATSTLHKL